MARLNRISYYAWNEDSVSTILLYIYKDSTFGYNFSDTITGKRRTKFYSGRFKAHGDSIFMNYEGKLPPGAMKYLVLEASRNYLIQPFMDGRRVFLLIKEFGHKGKN